MLKKLLRIKGKVNKGSQSALKQTPQKTWRKYLVDGFSGKYYVKVKLSNKNKIKFWDAQVDRNLATVINEW